MGFNRVYIHFFLFMCAVVLCLWTGCKTRQPVIVDTGDIERLRYEYQQLGDEYNRLQSDYQRLTAESKFYAEYYQHTTETISAGIGELAALGNGNAAEITKLRSYIVVLRNIVNGIIAGQPAEGREDSQVDGED